MFVEMEQMASRPFAVCAVEIADLTVEEIPEKKEPAQDLRKRKKVSFHANFILEKNSPRAIT